MKINTLFDSDNHCIGSWLTDAADILEAAFLDKPQQIYPKGHYIKSINVLQDEAFAIFWDNAHNWELQTFDVDVLKALWFDEFGSLKVNF